jgi:hypothetical protein
MSTNPKPPPAPLTDKQLRAIRAAVTWLDMTDETYRAMLAQYRRPGGEGPCTSTKHLTRAQARNLLTRFQLQGFPLNRPYSGHRPRHDREQDAPTTLPTPAQRALIERLRAEIAWRTPDGYDRWRQARLRIDHLRTYRHADAVIEGLKKLKEHGHARTT